MNAVTRLRISSARGLMGKSIGNSLIGLRGRRRKTSGRKNFGTEQLQDRTTSGPNNFRTEPLQDRTASGPSSFRTMSGSREQAAALRHAGEVMIGVAEQGVDHRHALEQV